MTDNEKRAHDLAIAMIPIEYENHKSLIINEVISENTAFDAFEEYMRYYDSALETFNRHFPEK